MSSEMKAPTAYVLLVFLVGVSLLFPASVIRGSEDDPAVRPDWISAWQKLQALAREEGPGADAKLHHILTNSPSIWLRGRALTALAQRQHPEALNLALVGTRSEDLVYRGAALEALGCFEDKGAVARLKDALREKANPKIRWTAAHALARIQHEQAWSAIEQLLDPPHTDTVRLRVRTLAEIGTEEARGKIQDLFGAKVRNDIRIRAIRACLAIDESWCTAMLLRFCAGESNRAARDVALGVLRSSGAESLAASLADAIRDDAETRQFAIDLLLERPSPEGGRALVKFLNSAPNDIDQTMLMRAMDALLLIRPTGYMTAFNRYKDDPNPQIRMRTLITLAIGKNEAEIFSLVKQAMSDPDDDVFKQALQLMQAYTTGVPPEGLSGYFEDSLATADATRAMVIMALLKDRLRAAEVKQALKVLDPYLAGSDEKLRNAAASVFVQIADEPTMSKVAAAEGYITRWMLLGPFPNNVLNEGFKETFVPETKVDFRTRVTFADLDKTIEALNWEIRPAPAIWDSDELTWTPFRVNRLSGEALLNMVVAESTDYAVCYAVADFDAATAQAVRVEIEADDTFVCWINGEEIASEPGDNISYVMADTTEAKRALENKWQKNRHKKIVEKVSLRAGRNRIMIKVCNYTSFWFFKVRLTHDDGRRVMIQEVENTPSAKVDGDP